MNPSPEMVEKARALYAEIDDIARDYDCYDYGLPAADRPREKCEAKLLEFADSAVREVVRELRPYLHHHSHRYLDAGAPCDCGLAEILKRFELENEP